MNIRDHHHIILVGSGGAGKSWMAKHIALITGYPLFHLDKEFWQPGWVMTPREERLVREQAMIAGESWIIDG